MIPKPGTSYDVAVIGAGVFGVWTALQLRRRGARVILIDAHGPANSRSSSGDESRIIRMGYGGDEIYTRSAVRSLDLWKELFAQAGASLFHQTGVLWLAHEHDPYPLQTVETLQRVGVKCEVLTPHEAATRYPQFAFDGISCAVLEPESGVLLARRAVQAVFNEAMRNGVEYLLDAVVAPVAARKLECIALTSGGAISAENFVFACGPWLPKLFPDLLANRIRPTRQEVFYFGTPPGDVRFASPPLPTWIDFKNEAYGLPDIDGCGLKCAIDRHGETFDPDTGYHIATSEGLAEVRRYLARRMPAMKDAPLIESRVCQYENTSNGDFLIDRHPDFDNVWLVGGGSGHGFKHGPAIGEYVAERIAGSEEIEPRFSLTGKKTEQERAVY
ncbi:MAG TPA: FAD-dependent oxidoreductase [Pyrinomonadaceae bacterium]|jgi:monomeric sarcosine oxidase|nr:FAD-dependent oxidoreductase [Pyrinomonadaceae bacterium]